VRESPVGNYFDADAPSLEKTVESLNRTELVYDPGTRTKYSNAGIAVLGLVLEQTQKQAFSRYVEKAVLAPAGLTGSSFNPDPEIVKNLAKGTMWTYHGREFPAPVFEWGIAPAAGLYSSASDLSKFLKVLFASGKTPTGVLISEKTLEQMWTPQFVKAGEAGAAKEGFGLGFYVSEFEGRRLVGHGGAVYGFSTQLSALPGEKLGVVVIASRDCTNGVTGRAANEALKQMLAVKGKTPLAAIREIKAVAPGRPRALAGVYSSKDPKADKDGGFALTESEGRLYHWPDKGGFRLELREGGGVLVADDRLKFGLELKPEGEGLRVGGALYQRRPEAKPADVPERWRGLIGEYGPDHSVLYILERNGRLHALIEWFFLYPLSELSKDVYAFPAQGGLYEGERLIFTRGADGKASRVEAGGVVFERRRLAGESGTFKIKPLLPVAELRKKALAATPPVERGIFRRPDLVELTGLEKGIKLDVRYATENSFLSTPFYSSARAFLQRPAAEAVVRVHRSLEKEGLGLTVFDGYRPWAVTKMFWEATPPDKRIFVADPEKGSRHNRGCAVDLTLHDLKTGKAVGMTGGYDEMSDRSYPTYPGGTSLQRYYRDRLRLAMEGEEFTVYEAEWWHFDYRDWAKYPIQNVRFEELGGK
jgi:serine beta-lactamase-like protein LACTB